jgi:hypothetical protein
MIFGWFKSKYILPEEETPWDYIESPYYNKEHVETMAIIEDIIAKLDEIKILIDEMKNGEDTKT